MTITKTLITRDQQITSVRVVSNANIDGVYQNGVANNGVGATLTIAASSLTVDSVVLEVPNRVLLTAQTSGYQNGIYEVSFIGSTVVLSRTDDFQTPDQMRPGYFVPVDAGTEFGGSMFGIIEPMVSIIGVSNILFANAASSPDSVTFSNTGLKIYNPAGTFTTTIEPTTAITDNRTLEIATGDADRILDLSAGDLVLTDAGLDLTNAADKNAQFVSLGIHSNLTGTWNGGGTTFNFPTPGVAATDIAVAIIFQSTNAVSLISVIAGTDQLVATFSGDPGNSTRLGYFVFPVITQ